MRQYTKAVAVLPRKVMFSLWMKVTLLSIEHRWGDAEWVKYFKATYLRTEPGRAGEEFLMGNWYYGVNSDLKKGYGPWQLPLEQNNGRL